MEPSSLRERSKVRRREAIKLAGMHLFATNGYDATTVADVAEAAEVAPRTVSLYFPTKLDIALASSSESSARLTALLSQQTAEQPVVEALLAWLREEQEAVAPQEQQLRRAMFLRNPALRALTSVQNDEAARAGLTALAREIGVAEDHPAARIAYGAVLGALQELALLLGTPEAAAQAQRAFGNFVRAGLAALGD